VRSVWQNYAVDASVFPGLLDAAQETMTAGFRRRHHPAHSVSEKLLAFRGLLLINKGVGNGCTGLLQLKAFPWYKDLGTKEFFVNHCVW
jgi:hypothetical protein